VWRDPVVGGTVVVKLRRGRMFVGRIARNERDKGMRERIVLRNGSGEENGTFRLRSQAI
jgi:hypothetical protein